MNEWQRATNKAKVYKEMYPKGTRLELISLDDPYTHIQPGAQGTVEMQWDDGKTLGLIPGEDSFKKI